MGIITHFSEAQRHPHESVLVPVMMQLPLRQLFHGMGGVVDGGPKLCPNPVHTLGIPRLTLIALGYRCAAIHFPSSGEVPLSEGSRKPGVPGQISTASPAAAVVSSPVSTARYRRRWVQSSPMPGWSVAECKSSPHRQGEVPQQCRGPVSRQFCARTRKDRRARKNKRPPNVSPRAVGLRCSCVG